MLPNSRRMPQDETDAILSLQSTQSSHGLRNMKKSGVGAESAYDTWSSHPSNFTPFISRFAVLERATDTRTLA
jgi:hypothetical protein